MDYEEKYKKALERAKKLQETCDSQAVVGWCEYLFPELAESEDERIRKELIRYLREHPNIPNGHYSLSDFYAWLEKQGKQDALKDLPKVETIIVNDWQYGKDHDHAVIPAIHQRIEGFNVGDKVKIIIVNEEQQ